MSYIDVEAEEILEEEELIEAVNEIVETAATAIYTDIKNDVSGALLKIRQLRHAMFPFWEVWREDRAIFVADMQKLALTVGLFLVSFWFLAPSRKWVKPTANSPEESNSWWQWLLGYREESTTDPDNESKTPNRFEAARKRGLERSLSASSISFGTSKSKVKALKKPEEIEESKEEKFAKHWPAILGTDYCHLVLPPECKRVEKPKRAKVPKTIEKAKEAKEKKGSNPDENPAQRLVYYMRQFLVLMVAFLKFDFVGAGWTLINWMNATLRTRQNRKTDLEKMKDDESKAGQQAEQTTESDGTEEDQSVPTPKLRNRSKRDSAVKLQRLEALQESSSQEAESGDPFATNDTTDQAAHISLDAPLLESLSKGGEEKKDSSGFDVVPATPPRTPMATTIGRPRQGSFGSVYESPMANCKLELREDGDGSYRPFLARRTASGTAKAMETIENHTTPTRKSYNEQVPNGSNLPSIVPVPDLRRQTDRTGSDFYFETANSDESLKRMAKEVPVPDKNGYIVGDEFLPDNNWTPVLVFVNSRSGPQQGHLLITQLRGLLNPVQIWDLADGGPEKVLESFTSMARLRILVCGGDGTVSWIVSTLEAMGIQRWPPIAILPLGTGNDLARMHGWGGGYNNESLIGILEQVATAYISWLDRWEMTISDQAGKVKEVKSFFNYLGVGADAQAALQVHLLRESTPNLFFSRVVNKAWYGIFGAEDLVKATSVNVPHEIVLYADGVEVPLPEDSQGIILLNIDSYAGGVPMWSAGSKEESSPSNSPPRGRADSFNGIPLQRSKSLDLIKERRKGPLPPVPQPEPGHPVDRVDSLEDLAALTEEEKYDRVTACDRPSSCQDGVLDVVSIRGPFHLGQIRVGLSNAQRLCQCREAKIVIKNKVSVQIDGEPWRQNVCTLQVKRKEKDAIMLHRSADESNGVETEMAKLLDWAEERTLIDGQVHAALMKEFSRRIEKKTRLRRERGVRSQDNLMSSFKRAMGSSSNLGGNATGLMF